jgi:hypothetical protein
MNLLKLFKFKSYDKARLERVGYMMNILDSGANSGITKSYNVKGELVRTSHNVLKKKTTFKYLLNPLEVKYGKNL